MVVLDAHDHAAGSRDTRVRRQATRRAAREVMGERLADPDLQLDVVAHEVLASRRQLQRVFTEDRTTFRAELCAMRVRVAIALLHHRPELRVAEVAQRVGYRQPSQFAKAFRRLTGTTPSAVRRADRGRVRTRAPGTSRGPAHDEGEDRHAEQGT